jgi:hypothetical protein
MFETGSTVVLLWPLLFGSIRFGFLFYGKNKKRSCFSLPGSRFVSFPILLANVYVLVLVGLLLIATPYFVWV